MSPLPSIGPHCTNAARRTCCLERAQVRCQMLSCVPVLKPSDHRNPETQTTEQGLLVREGLIDEFAPCGRCSSPLQSCPGRPPASILPSSTFASCKLYISGSRKLPVEWWHQVCGMIWRFRSPAQTGNGRFRRWRWLPCLFRCRARCAMARSGLSTPAELSGRALVLHGRALAGRVRNTMPVYRYPARLPLS